MSVGAGSGGSVVAARLAEVTGWSVLLLESGGPPPIEAQVPAYNLFLLQSDSEWNYFTTPQRHGLRAYKNRVSDEATKLGCLIAKGKRMKGPTERRCTSLSLSRQGGLSQGTPLSRHIISLQELGISVKLLKNERKTRDRVKPITTFKLVFTVKTFLNTFWRGFVSLYPIIIICSELILPLGISDASCLKEQYFFF